MAWRSSAAIGLIVSRIFVCLLGGAAVAWAIYVLPIFWVQSGVERTSKNIITGAKYEPSVLNAYATALSSTEIDKWDHPSVLASAALIHMRLLGNAIADGDQNSVDTTAASLLTEIRKALAYTPADSFLWFLLFPLENDQHGFKPDHLKYLRMSYLTGPNEGWVAVQRNPVALKKFSELSPDLAEHAVREFVQMVDSGFFDEAANILVTAGWPIRDKLLPPLKSVPPYDRETFAKIVYRLGFDASVPGVVLPEARPWD